MDVQVGIETQGPPIEDRLDALRRAATRFTDNPSTISVTHTLMPDRHCLLVQFTMRTTAQYKGLFFTGLHLPGGRLQSAALQLARRYDHREDSQSPGPHGYPHEIETSDAPNLVPMAQGWQDTIPIDELEGAICRWVQSACNACVLSCA
jgi:hypothetical protein